MPERDVPLRIWLATKLKGLFGIMINIFDFKKEEELPLPFRFYFRITDKNGKTILKGRDLEALKALYQQKFQKDPAGCDPASGISREFHNKIHSIHDLKDIMTQVRPRGRPDVECFWVGLVLEDDIIIKRAFIHREEAQKKSIIAIRELFFRLLRKEINSIKERFMDLHGLSLDAVSAFGGRDNLEDNILRLMAKEYFWREGEPLTYDKILERFKYLEKNIYKISADAVPGILNILRSWDNARMEMRALFNKTPRGYSESSYSMFMKRLHAILPEDFHLYVDMAELPDLERELQALTIRARRFYADPRKDALKERRIAPYRRFLQGLLKKADEYDSIPRLGELISQFRRHLKEFEIQTFAPEIRPRLRVSSKKLDQLEEDISMLLPGAKF